MNKRVRSSKVVEPHDCTWEMWGQRPPDTSDKEVGVKKKKVLCRCCGKPAVGPNGKPKKAPICWDCIVEGGSVERACGKHGNLFGTHLRAALDKEGS